MNAKKFKQTDEYITVYKKVSLIFNCIVLIPIINFTISRSIPNCNQQVQQVVQMSLKKYRALKLPRPPLSTHKRRLWSQKYIYIYIKNGPFLITKTGKRSE